MLHLILKVDSSSEENSTQSGIIWSNYGTKKSQKSKQIEVDLEGKEDGIMPILCVL